ncbi:rod shape-determining protein RodA [Zoogloea sp.]|uniref:rod shape-determining protein RodA n=1 Tax=Zoogloea sp. TaxID=49181 RepID=UPI001B4078FE|nr:rod shape-determining protein RodA [Zoogloea sp.]MBK6655251.1 rod shape-determining protein RodA [Zoogloea sp.]MBP7444049.1 rod shape-determining protein RodA [Zoogloea sp.]HOY00634.1 rod shape-determining protein RodA [Zoogloea sp.]
MNPRLDPRKWLSFLLSPLDGPLMLLVLALTAYSAVIMVSASPERLGTLAVNTAVAFFVMWVAARIPPQRMMSIALPLYVIGIVLLVAVALFGDVSKGARRWLNIGITRIQPSELMKIAMPLTLAWYFQSREGMIRGRDFLIAISLLLLPVGLIAKQPDLGTAILVTASGFFVLFFAGLTWRLILPVAVVGIVGIASIVAMGDTICQPGVDWPGLREYQKHRVCTLLDPTSDPLGKGFHIIQSTIAIGSGGVVGKGWGNGTQTHLDFLPERHTDFIFAVLTEEFGLVGALILVVIYILLIFRGLFIAAGAPTLFSRLLAGALTLIFFTYALVNMGMVSGILPVVGVPLPFVSYGGTALVTLCLGVGMLMSIQRHRRRVGT